ncbi:MAG: hypothetical protein R3F43_25010 [bacterium]
MLARPVRPLGLVAGPLTVVSAPGIGKKVRRALAAGKADAELARLRAAPGQRRALRRRDLVGGRRPRHPRQPGVGQRAGDGRAHRRPRRRPPGAHLGRRRRRRPPGRRRGRWQRQRPPRLGLRHHAAGERAPGLRRGGVDRDWGNEEKLAALAAAGKKAEMLAIYRRYRPMGRCSMDTGPPRPPGATPSSATSWARSAATCSSTSASWATASIGWCGRATARRRPRRARRRWWRPESTPGASCWA